MTKRHSPDNFRWVLPDQYPYRCKACNAPAFTVAIEGDLICRECLDKRRSQQLPNPQTKGTK